MTSANLIATNINYATISGLQFFSNQGEWQSLQDSSYRVISILNSTIGTGYFLIKVEKDKSNFCYAISDISDSYLELGYAGGRLLSFKKIRGNSKP
jgi:hypothetical protein